jgi:hypothetical protein
MPILIVILCFVIILVGALTPASENATRSARQANLDQAVFENRRFADASEALFRNQKTNFVLGFTPRDAENIPHPTGLQLVQEQLFSIPGQAEKFSSYTAEPVSPTDIQNLITRSLGTIPNFIVMERKAQIGDTSLQRWTISIEDVRFQYWLLGEDAWLVSKFGPTQGPKYSRWIALVNVTTNETYWRDPLGVDCPANTSPNGKCTSPVNPTRGVSLAAVRYKRVFEMAVCFGKAGAAAAPACENFVVNGWNACTEPKCENFVVGTENGCLGGEINQYSKQLVRVSP